jgi:hypothetical protein
MKLSPHFAIRFALLAGMTFSVVTGSALAADNLAGNIATADNGAYIVYSTPLQGGNSANFLTQDFRHKLAFSSQPGSKLIVLDLGKTYSLGSVGLKFTNPVRFEVYVVESKPKGGDWISVLGGKPDFISTSAGLATFLKGRQGRYLIFVADGDPGFFYGLYVTGVYVPYPNNGGEFAGIIRPHNPNDDTYGYLGGLSESPFPRQDYYPGVYPPSP